MESEAARIGDFLAQRSLAIAGVSRSGKGFGAIAARELSRRGYDVHILHPEAAEIQGRPCAKSLAEVAGRVGGLLISTPARSTETLVREAARAGIRRVWIVQGGESEAAIRACRDSGIEAIHGRCILMFAQPGGVHRFHRFLSGIFGRLPA